MNILTHGDIISISFIFEVLKINVINEQTGNHSDKWNENALNWVKQGEREITLMSKLKFTLEWVNWENEKSLRWENRLGHWLFASSTSLRGLCVRMTFRRFLRTKGTPFVSVRRSKYVWAIGEWIDLVEARGKNEAPEPSREKKYAAQERELIQLVGQSKIDPSTGISSWEAPSKLTTVVIGWA